MDVGYNAWEHFQRGDAYSSWSKWLISFCFKYWSTEDSYEQVLQRDDVKAIIDTEFVQVFFHSHLKMHVWKRGAGATLSCGTGACAVVVAAVLEGRAGRICTVDLPRGPLEIEWREEDNHVYMTGPTEVVFYGSVPL